MEQLPSLRQPTTPEHPTVLPLQARRFGTMTVSLCERIEHTSPHELLGSNITMLMMDADDTIAPFSSETVDPALLDWLATSRHDSYFETVGLISNRPDPRRLHRLGRQLQADFIITPRSLTDLKPSPAMVERMLERADTTPEHAHGIGNAVTDIVAYHRARMNSTLVDPYGRRAGLRRLVPNVLLKLPNCLHRHCKR